MPRQAVVLVAALALAVTGCGDKEPSGKRSDRSAKPSASNAAPATPYQAPDGAPVLFDQTRAKTLKDPGVFGLAVTADRAITLSGEIIRGRELPGLKKAWEVTVPKGLGFRGFWLTQAEDAAIAVASGATESGGTAVGEDVISVQRLDPETGEGAEPALVKLRKDPRAPTSAPSVRVVGLLGDTVILDLSHPAATNYAPHRTLAVSEGGEIRWRADGEPLAVGSGTVVVSTGYAGAPGDVRGLGAKGKVRWRQLPLTTDAALVGTTPRGATVAHVGYLGLTEVVALSWPKGRVMKRRVVPSADLICLPAASQSAVCRGKDTLSGWNLAKTRMRWSLPTRTRYAPLMTDVVGRSVYGVVGLTRPVMLDALTGKDTATQPGAAPVAVNGWGGLTLAEGQVRWIPAAQWPPASGSPSAAPSGEATASATASSSPSPSETSSSASGSAVPSLPPP